MPKGQKAKGPTLQKQTTQRPPQKKQSTGLRALQGRKQLEHLMRFVKAARDRLEWGPPGAPPLLVKVAPDLDAAALKDVAAAATAAGVDGIVVGNTTVARPRE